MQFLYEDYVTRWVSEEAIGICTKIPGTKSIYWSTVPDGFTDDNELPRFEAETVVLAPSKAYRRYYHIFSQDKYSIAAPRILISDGVANLRDLGGYNTEDGSAFVAFGNLYRSHMLDAMDKEGCALVQSFGLRSIVDLRMPREIHDRPDPVIEGAEYYNLSPMANDESGKFAVSIDAIIQICREKGSEVMKEEWRRTYGEMVFNNDAYRRMFDLLVRQEFPMLFHCAAGKDRTGIAAALILWALDVPKETIIYDYLLTNEARTGQTLQARSRILDKVEGDEKMADIVMFFIGVDRTSIQAVFDEIDRRGLNKKEFFEQEMGLSAEKLQHLKDKLLVRHKIV